MLSLVALNAFIKFVGRDSYMCNDISKVFMRSFEKWLGDKKTARSVYPQVIKRMFNSAKQRYNEGREENKVIKRTLSRELWSSIIRLMWKSRRRNVLCQWILSGL